MPSWLCAMSEMATSQPAWARPMAIARPMPRAAPVTSATFPSSSIDARVSEAGRRVHRADRELNQLGGGLMAEAGTIKRTAGGRDGPCDDGSLGLDPVRRHTRRALDP